MKLAATLLAASLLCSASTVALAQQTSGFYLGIGAGGNFLRDADVSAPGFNTTAEFDPGWAGLGTFGYGYGNGLRVELELGYRSNDLDTISPGTAASGDMSAFSAMVNALYDIPTGTPFTPYLGAGIGYARVNLDFTGTVGATTITGDDSDNVFAYQGIAGVAYGLTPNLKLSLDYRYFGTQDAEYGLAGGGTLETEYQAHTVMLGLRWEFGAPQRPAPTPAVMVPPAPPPAPAPAPVVTPPPPPAPPAEALRRSFLVFFDFDRSNITPEADRVIRDAAATAKRGNVARITATGHADRSGPERYNMALSMRRADAVKAVLIREGIPASQIAVVARGETQPLVPTADGVREPQNRRVEIVLQ